VDPEDATRGVGGDQARTVGYHPSDMLWPAEDSKGGEPNQAHEGRSHAGGDEQSPSTGRFTGRERRTSGHLRAVRLSDEAIALPLDRLDVVRLVWVVPQHPSYLSHCLLDRIDLLPTTPNLTQKFGLGNHAAPVFNKELQRGKGLRRELQLLCAAPDSTELPVEMEVAETNHGLLRQRIQGHSSQFQRLISAFSVRKGG
jgi:hypothetical protein